MQIVHLSIIIDSIVTDNMKEKLYTNGWNLVNENLLTISKQGFILSLIINKKGNYFSLNCTRRTDNQKYVDLPSFSLKEAWNIIWNKESTFDEVIMYTINNYEEELLSNGWEHSIPLINGLETNKENDISWFRYKDEGKTYYKIVHSKKANSSTYLTELKKLGFPL